MYVCLKFFCADFIINLKLKIDTVLAVSIKNLMKASAVLILINLYW